MPERRAIGRMLLELASTCNRYSPKHDEPFNEEAHRAVTAIDVWPDSILHYSQFSNLTPAQFLSKCRTDAQREVHRPSFYPLLARLRPCSRPEAMRLRTTILFVSAIAAGSIAGLPCVCAEGPDMTAAVHSRDDSSACADRYNLLLGQAKASLLKGDRDAAVDSLVAAKVQLRRCRELEERNSSAPVGIALNNTLSVSIE